MTRTSHARASIAALVLLGWLAPTADAQTWSRRIDLGFNDFAFDMTELPTGELVVVGNLLYVFDAAGNLIQSQATSGGVYFTCVQAAADGTLWFAGEDWLQSPGLDEQGVLGQLAAGPSYTYAVLRQTDLFDSVFDTTVIGEIRPTADGGAFAVGAHEEEEDVFHNHAWAYRLDAAGNVLWDAQLESFWTDASSGLELSDGSFALVGQSDGDLFVAKLSATGQWVWRVEFAGEKSGRGRIDETSDGNLVIASGFRGAGQTAWSDPGGYWFDGDTGFLVLEMDTNGNVVWSRRYAGSERDYATDVVATPDGGSIVVGTTTSFGADGRDIRVMRLDGDGEVEWQWRYGHPGDDDVFDVALLANGDIGLTGLHLPPNEEWDGFVMRLDPGGQLAGCPGAPTWASPVDAGLVPQGTPHFDPGLDDPTLLVTADLPDFGVTTVTTCPGEAVGARYCDPASPNSTGLPAVITVAGDEDLAENDMTLIARQLPAHQFGYFIGGQSSGTSQPPGTQGTLCLVGGQVHRFKKPVLSSEAAGAFGTSIDLTAVPQYGAVQPGETWNFQAWYRDMNPGSTSNFTDAVGVTFP